MVMNLINHEVSPIETILQMTVLESCDFSCITQLANIEIIFYIIGMMNKQ